MYPLYSADNVMCLQWTVCGPTPAPHTITSTATTPASPLSRVEEVGSVREGEGEEEKVGEEEVVMGMSEEGSTVRVAELAH